eukprot:TRINITY_DN31145_c0_g1_i1.p1 TRINITY_DN31145_c0_g1~~TRINITY_DN31145_c0_g1_i1.p1  ORF type:complete len:102 (-),score=4.25 TRINITY_DN31145_c0_g1_i1:46-351(-)
MQTKDASAKGVWKIPFVSQTTRRKPSNAYIANDAQMLCQWLVHGTKEQQHLRRTAVGATCAIEMAGITRTSRTLRNGNTAAKHLAFVRNDLVLKPRRRQTK